MPVSVFMRSGTSPHAYRTSTTGDGTGELTGPWLDAGARGVAVEAHLAPCCICFHSRGFSASSRNSSGTQEVSANTTVA